jgi:hypothetical protein
MHIRSILNPPCSDITDRTGRRCRLASAAVRLASSRYLLQGAFEKIHLQRPLRQKLLQLPVLVLQPRKAWRDGRNRPFQTPKPTV